MIPVYVQALIAVTLVMVICEIVHQLEKRFLFK